MLRTNNILLCFFIAFILDHTVKKCFAIQFLGQNAEQPFKTKQKWHPVYSGAISRTHVVSGQKAPGLNFRCEIYKIE